MSESPLSTAVAAYQAGQYDAAALICRDALARHARDESLGMLLALAEHAAGRNEGAVEAFRALTEWFPDGPVHWSNLGYMLRLTGRYADAEGAFVRALALDPRHFDALLNYGLLLLDMGRLGAARHRFLDAVEVDPSSASARIYAASACFECGDLRRAEELIPPPQSWPGLDNEQRHDLAMALINVGRVDEAERMLAPNGRDEADAKAMARLAMLHERTNRIESARALLDRVREHIESDRDLAMDALTVDAALAMRDRDYARGRVAAEALLATGLPAPAEANALFTLATIADKEGDTRAAMDFLAKAHAIHFRLASEIVPEVAGSSEEPLRIATKWMRAEQCGFAAASSGNEERAPVFIVGFPRSGTTMLEQMLDAHPRFVSMDEQPILQRCIEEMQKQGHEYPYELDRVDVAGLERIRAVYWAEVAKIVSLSDGQVLVDKNPLNLLRLPMIRRLFPSARIILALRHPCDVILSCYMQNFRSPAFMVLCSSLERLASSYVNSMRSWIHHQQLLRPDVLLLRYEETVTDFERQVRRIAEYLDIADEHHLAEFSRHASAKRYISTPSYSQVIEPVNTKALARWQRYRTYFEPILPTLQPVAEHWGYTFSE